MAIIRRVGIVVVACVALVTSLTGSRAAEEAEDGARFVRQSVPRYMVAGRQYEVSITMRNTGASTWRAQDGFRLGAQSPQDNPTWGLGRLLLEAADRIRPSQTKTFKATIFAPSQAGTHDFQWQMVHEAVGWFGDMTPKVKVKVGGPAPEKQK